MNIYAVPPLIYTALYILLRHPIYTPYELVAVITSLAITIYTLYSGRDITGYILNTTLLILPIGELNIYPIPLILLNLIYTWMIHSVYRVVYEKPLITAGDRGYVIYTAGEKIFVYDPSGEYLSRIVKRVVERGGYYRINIYGDKSILRDILESIS